MFKLDVYCRRTLNTIPPRDARAAVAAFSAKPAVREGRAPWTRASSRSAGGAA